MMQEISKIILIIKLPPNKESLETSKGGKKNIPRGKLVTGICRDFSEIKNVIIKHIRCMANSLFGRR